MNRSVIKILLSAVAIGSFSTEFASAAANPVIDQFFYPGLLDAKMKVGKDGNIRLIWDYVAGGGYSRSAPWIFLPKRSLLAGPDPNDSAPARYAKPKHRSVSLYS